MNQERQFSSNSRDSEPPILTLAPLTDRTHHTAVDQSDGDQGRIIFADILVHVDESEAGKRRLHYAFDLAERTHAHVTGIHVSSPPDISSVYKPSKIPALIRAMNHREAEVSCLSRESFEAEASRSSTPACWHSLQGQLPTEICKLARSADIVVLGQYEWERVAEHHLLSVAEKVVLDCGRPVLVVPQQIYDGRIKRALIAWDGSREAVRALHEALPLLQAWQSTADIAVLDRHEPMDDLARVLEHLQRHGITLGDNIYIDAHESGAAALIERTTQGHYDLLVMGAFGHPAWKEALFGGTTISVCEQTTTPILFSH